MAVEHGPTRQTESDTASGCGMWARERGFGAYRASTATRGAGRRRAPRRPSSEPLCTCTVPGPDDGQQSQRRLRGPADVADKTDRSLCASALRAPVAAGEHPAGLHRRPQQTRASQGADECASRISGQRARRPTRTEEGNGRAGEEMGGASDDGPTRMLAPLLPVAGTATQHCKSWGHSSFENTHRKLDGGMPPAERLAFPEPARNGGGHGDLAAEAVHKVGLVLRDDAVTQEPDGCTHTAPQPREIPAAAMFCVSRALRCSALLAPSKLEQAKGLAPELQLAQAHDDEPGDLGPVHAVHKDRVGLGVDQELRDEVSGRAGVDVNVAAAVVVRGEGRAASHLENARSDRAVDRVLLLVDLAWDVDEAHVLCRAPRLPRRRRLRRHDRNHRPQLQAACTCAHTRGGRTSCGQDQGTRAASAWGRDRWC